MNALQPVEKKPGKKTRQDMFGKRLREAMLEFIREYWRVRERPPNIREVASHVGRAISTTADNLQILRREGYLAHTPPHFPGIYLADSPPEPRGQDLDERRAIRLLSRLWRDMRRGQVSKTLILEVKQYLIRPEYEKLPNFIHLEGQ